MKAPTWSCFKPQLLVPEDILHPRMWLGRQRRNGAIAWEYAKYRMKLSGTDLRQYACKEMLANNHILPVVRVTPERPLRIFGMWKNHDWEDYNLLPALRDYGSVFHYDPQDDYDPDCRERSGLSHMRRMQDKALELIRAGSSGVPWDVLFFYVSASWVEPSFLETVRSLGIPMINFCGDDIVSFDGGEIHGRRSGNVDIVRYFTICFTPSTLAFHKIMAVGGTPYWLPVGANPYVYRRMDGVEKDLDVVFVGSYFYDRKEVIECLIKRGVSVHAFGRGWPNGHIGNQEQIHVLNRAKIVLGFNRYSGSDWMGVKGRDLEVPMTGAFHLVNDYPELGFLYEVGREVAVYQNRRDLLDRIRFYLANPLEREAIAKWGCERARREHAWQGRLGGLFEKLGLVTKQKREDVMKKTLEETAL